MFDIAENCGQMQPMQTKFKKKVVNKVLKRGHATIFDIAENRGQMKLMF